MKKSSSPFDGNPIIAGLKKDKEEKSREKQKLENECQVLNQQCKELKHKIKQQEEMNQQENIIDLRNSNNFEEDLKHYRNPFEIEEEEKTEEVKIIPLKPINHSIKNCSYEELIRNFHKLAPEIYLTKSNEKNFTEFKVTLEIHPKKSSNQEEFIKSIEGRNPTIFIGYKKSLLALTNLPEIPKKFEEGKTKNKNRDDKKTYIKEEFKVEMLMYDGEIMKKESYIKMKDKTYNGFDLYDSSKIFSVIGLFEVMNGNVINFFKENIFDENNKEMYEMKNFDEFYEGQKEDEDHWGTIDYMIVGNWVAPSN